VHVHGLRASVPLKTSKRVCSSPPAWRPVAILVQSSEYFNSPGVEYLCQLLGGEPPRLSSIPDFYFCWLAPSKRVNSASLVVHSLCSSQPILGLYRAGFLFAVPGAVAACTLDSPVALLSAVLRAEALLADFMVAVRASWTFGALVQDFFSCFSTSPHHIAQGCFLGEQGWIVVASRGWWPGQWPAFQLAAGRKLCAPGGGRAAGSALHELGGLGSVTIPVEAKVKIQNSLHGKGAQACQSGCSGRVLASTWVRFWRAFGAESNVHSAGRDGWEDLRRGCAPGPSRVCTGEGHTCPREQSTAQASRHERLARGQLDFGGILLLPEFPLAAISIPSSLVSCVAQSLA
jgi:hypothetical protein